MCQNYVYNLLSYAHLRKCLQQAWWISCRDPEVTWRVLPKQTHRWSKSILHKMLRQFRNQCNMFHTASSSISFIQTPHRHRFLPKRLYWSAKFQFAAWWRTPYTCVTIDFRLEVHHAGVSTMSHEWLRPWYQWSKMEDSKPRGRDCSL